MDENKRTPNKSVVIGTIGSDAHMIGGWVISEAFKAAGYKVSYLGAVVPQEEFINAAIESDADAILCSSMYGMGQIDCEGMREKCIEAGIGDIILYVGGNPVADVDLIQNWSAVEKIFADMGFNRCLPNTTSAEETVALLNKDLGFE